MLDHLEIETRKIAETADSYRLVLAPLGYAQLVDGTAIGFGDGVRLDCFVRFGEPSCNIHFAFEIDCRARVDEIFEIARQGNLRLVRPPALAPNVHANYYAGYLRDPDGRLVEFVCHKQDQSADAAVAKPTAGYLPPGG